MSTDPYDQIAPLYDLLHVTLTEDSDFILSLAARTGDPILELGCGTGRLLLPLAQKGYHVTGVDRSEAMLRRARRRLTKVPPDVQARVRLLAGDMTSPGLQPEQYRLALISYNTFMHVEPAQAVNVCRAVRHCLLPDGLLFLDLTNPLLLAQAPNDRAVTLEGTLKDLENDRLVTVFTSHALREAVQILSVTWIYDSSPLRGGAVQRTIVEMNYHYYYPHELEILLQQSGFILEAIYGDYQGHPFSESSQRLLVLARRA